MGLETQFLYIDDLNVSNPASTDGLNQADNHLRGIKNVLTNQFPDLGSAIVTATAAEINDVANKLTSFNGRTGPAILPAAGDYDINDLGDVDTTGLADGDLLVYNSTSGNFEVAKQGIAQASLTEQSYIDVDDTTGDQIEWDATVYNSGTGITIDTGSNQLTNDTGQTIVARITAMMSFTGSTGAQDMLFELRKNGTTIGEDIYFNHETPGSTDISFERIVSMADGDDIELWIKTQPGTADDTIQMQQGGTITLQILPGA